MTTESASKPESYGSINSVLPLLGYLENEGFELGSVLDEVGIPRSALEDAHMRLPKGKFDALWRAAIAATGDPALALRVSTIVQANTLGIVGYLASASESRRSAFELVKNLTPLLWEDFECDLESDGQVAFFRCRTSDDPRDSRFTAEYFVGITIAMSRLLGTTRSEPIEARFTHAAPDYADEYERILQLPVRFDAEENGVLFPSSMMDSLNPSADAALRQLLEQHAADQLARISTRARFSERVRAFVLSMLPHGELTADAAAAHFAMSNRTLRRRLSEESTSYQEILDDVRADLARHYLTKERRTVDEVAYLLGFSDPSAFTKAFRRWTGETPADYARTRSA